MILLDGKETARRRLRNLQDEIAKLAQSTGKQPNLAVVRVGEDPASKIYVRKKVKTCKELGIGSEETLFSNNISQEELEEKINQLNQNPKVHGILVQLPLPPQIDSSRIIQKISPHKDVDGFHPENLGLLLSQRPRFVACTPLGIMHLLKTFEIPIAGKKAVVMGRSLTVGRPMSLLLDHAGATVTVVHLKTPEPHRVTQEADLLVVATGQGHLVDEKYIKKDATVVDVGIHRTEKGKLFGDVCFDEVKNKVHAITPVPGGVGPMTIASLMENSLQAFRLSLK